MRMRGRVLVLALVAGCSSAHATPASGPVCDPSAYFLTRQLCATNPLAPGWCGLPAECQPCRTEATHRGATEPWQVHQTIVDDKQRVIGEAFQIGTNYAGTQTCVASGRGRLRCVRIEPGGRAESEVELVRGRMRTWRTDGTVWTFRYDSAGRLVKESVAVEEHRTERTWTYDAAGRMLEERAAEVVTTFAYDERGRLVEMRADGGADGPEITRVSWDASGREAVVTDALGATTWRFDARGRALSAEQALRSGVVGGYGTATYIYACPAPAVGEPQLAR
jgi:YD repeat-containing protein